jgi:Ca2+/Na+ antiporter
MSNGAPDIITSLMAASKKDSGSLMALGSLYGANVFGLSIALACIIWSSKGPEIKINMFYTTREIIFFAVTTLGIFVAGGLHFSSIGVGVGLVSLYLVYVVIVFVRDHKDRRASEEEKEKIELEDVERRKNSIEKDQFNVFDFGEQQTLLVRKNSKDKDMLHFTERRWTEENSTQVGPTQFANSLLTNDAKNQNQKPSSNIEKIGSYDFLSTYDENERLVTAPLLQRVSSPGSNKHTILSPIQERNPTPCGHQSECSSLLLDEDKMIETSMLASQGSNRESCTLNPWNKTFLKAHYRFSTNFTQAKGFNKFMWFIDWPIQFIIDCTIPPVDRPLIHPKALALFPFTYIWTNLYFMGYFWIDLKFTDKFSLKLLYAL